MAIVVALLVPIASAFLVATPAHAGPDQNVLRSGESLGPGQKLATSNGIVVIMQGDGNLVEYAPGNRPVWASNTNRAGSIVRMQGDGNLVVIAPGNVPVWSSRTGGNSGAGLELQTDGNLVVYASGHIAKWANGVRISTSAPAPTATPTATTNRVVALTNAERAKKPNCPALRVDSRLTTSAQDYSALMARRGQIDHHLDGGDARTRMEAAGYRATLYAENLAKGHTSPEQVVSGWMGSAGHRANILDCRLRAIGVGYVAGGNYWTQHFGNA